MPSTLECRPDVQPNKPLLASFHDASMGCHQGKVNVEVGKEAEVERYRSALMQAKNLWETCTKWNTGPWKCAMCPKSVLAMKREDSRTYLFCWRRRRLGVSTLDARGRNVVDENVTEDAGATAILRGPGRTRLAAFALFDLFTLGGSIVGAPASVTLGNGIGLVLLEAQVVTRAVCLINVQGCTGQQRARGHVARNRTLVHRGRVQARAEADVIGGDRGGPCQEDQKHDASWTGIAQERAHHGGGSLSEFP